MARKGRHGRPDSLQVQVALSIKAPPNMKIAPEVLTQIIDRMVAGQELPPNVKVRGIFWRNPNRRGSLAHWRYHEGADLSAAPTSAPLESSPRGSLSDATSTLGGALYSGVITF
jgi:hypothetical protein